MDGTKIVLSMTQNGNTDIFINSLDTGIKRRLTTNSAIDTAQASPQMERVLFLKVTGEVGNNFTLFLAKEAKQKE